MAMGHVCLFRERGAAPCTTFPEEKIADPGVVSGKMNGGGAVMWSAQGAALEDRVGAKARAYRVCCAFSFQASSLLRVQ